MKRLLFICSENRLRSPTAEAVFSEYDGVEAIGAGTNADAETPERGDLIEWADIVFVMEKVHGNKVSKKYKELLKDKRVVVLDIPDIYECMQPELIGLLKAKVSKVVPLGRAAYITKASLTAIIAADEVRCGNQKEVMKKLHLAIATNDIAVSVQDYTLRLGSQPCVVVDNQYALWRTETINMSVRQDSSCKPGELRHLGWEDPEALQFTSSTDVNDILWEHFSAEQQAEEIEQTWPGTGYTPNTES